MTDDDTSYERQTAVRALASEALDATRNFKESDAERAPVFNLLPTGERANRLFIVGTLTETEDVGSDSEYWQGKVVDPAGDAYYVYAGQYQQEAAAMLRSLEPPAYVAAVCKFNTYETDEGDVNVSLVPESLTEVDGETRDQWAVETVSATLDRIEAFRAEKSTMEQQMAEKAYGQSVSEYLDAALESLETIDGADVSVEAEAPAEASGDGEGAEAGAD